MTSILFIQSEPPHGQIKSQEGLDAILMGSAFTDCAVLFLGEGVLQLLPEQQPDQLGSKNYALAYGALKDYGVSSVFCSRDALNRFGLEPGQLMIETVPLAAGEIHDLLTRFDKTLNI